MEKTTEQLTEDFKHKNGDPLNTDLWIEDNKDGTITLTLEAISQETFKKPKDFDEWVKTLEE